VAELWRNSVPIGRTARWYCTKTVVPTSPEGVSSHADVAKPGGEEIRPGIVRSMCRLRRCQDQWATASGRYSSAATASRGGLIARQGKAPSPDSPLIRLISAGCLRDAGFALTALLSHTELASGGASGSRDLRWVDLQSPYRPRAEGRGLANS
jgi:hypothetical protein